MNYDKLTPGRELDAEVAEIVMELDRVKFDSDDNELIYKREPKALSWSFVPHYSTSIAAAWKVWKHFFTGEQYTETLYRFTAHFQDPNDDDEPLYEIFQMIDPFEICIAALKATETQQ